VFTAHWKKLTAGLLALGLVILAAPLSRVRADDNHRLLVLDIGRAGPGPDYYRLLLVDVEVGKILAQAELGYNPDIALSPKGDEVAVPSGYRVAGRAEGDSLEFFRVTDLTRLERGRLPAARTVYKDRAPGSPACQLSPDGKALIVQRVQDFGQDRHQVLLSCVQRELDSDKAFKLSPKLVTVPPFRHLDFLRVADWPKVHIWNGGFLDVVDFSSGKIASRLLLNDDPSLQGIDPEELEKPSPDQRKSLWSHSGWVVTDSGKYAYYISHHYADDDKPGSLRKIDLSADPPKVIRETKINPQQGLGITGVSEAAGIFYGIDYKPPSQGRHVPTRRVKIYDKETAKLLKEIDLSLTDCQRLVASRDGKYLFALNPDEAKLAVIDIASRKEIKVLDHLGKYPWMMVALPETKPEK
jgi:hypothetical protein